MSTSKFDDLLTQLGTGKWNLLYFLGSAYSCLCIPPQFISGVYLAPAVSYTCLPPENESVVEISQDSCSYMVRTSSSAELEEELCSEWDFDTSVFSSTLTSEFSLVCGRGHLRATYQSIYMLGTFFSPLLAGYLADRFGRKIVLVVTQVVTALTSLSLCFLTNFIAILIVRFITGSFNLLTFFILALEVCEPKHRGTVGILTGLPWALGTMAWGAMAYLIRDWRWLQAAASLPSVLNFFPLYFMDESPRWLIVNGQHDSALRVLQKAARWNNATIPLEEDLRDLMRNIQDESSTPLREPGTPLKKVGRKKLCGFLPVPSLLSTRAITIVTLVMCFDFFVVSLVFDGLNLSGDNYSADPFLYIVLGGLMEVPGYSLTALIINRWGRRIPTALSYILCGLVILVLTFIPNEVSWLAMTLAMAGKMSISGAFQIISIYSSELFPTKVRLQGIGASSEFSQLASTVLPYITTYLGTFIPWVPSVIFGCLSMMAGLATLALHETMGIALPDTISDLSSTVKRTLKNKTDDDEDLEKENLQQ